MDGLSIVGIACDEVRADRARLDLLDKLSVAIVHEAHAVGLPFVDAGTEPTNGLHAE